MISVDTGFNTDYPRACYPFGCLDEEDTAQIETHYIKWQVYSLILGPGVSSALNHGKHS